MAGNPPRDIYAYVGIDIKYGMYIEERTLRQLVRFFEENLQQDPWLRENWYKVIKSMHYKLAKICDPRRQYFTEEARTKIGPTAEAGDLVPRYRIHCMQMIAWTLLHNFGHHRKLYGGFIRDYIVAHISPNDFDIQMTDDEAIAANSKRGLSMLDQQGWINALYDQLRIDWPEAFDARIFGRPPAPASKGVKNIVWQMELSHTLSRDYPDGVRALVQASGFPGGAAQITQTPFTIDFDTQRRFFSTDLNGYPGSPSDIDNLAVTSDGLTLKRLGLLNKDQGQRSPFSNMAVTLYHAARREFIFYQNPTLSPERLLRLQARGCRVLNLDANNQATPQSQYPYFWMMGTYRDIRGVEDFYFAVPSSQSIRDKCEAMIKAYTQGYDITGRRPTAATKSATPPPLAIAPPPPPPAVRPRGTPGPRGFGGLGTAPPPPGPPAVRPRGIPVVVAPPPANFQNLNPGDRVQLKNGDEAIIIARNNGTPITYFVKIFPAGALAGQIKKVDIPITYIDRLLGGGSRNGEIISATDINNIIGGENNSQGLDEVIENIPLPLGQDTSQNSLKDKILNLKENIGNVKSIINSKKTEGIDQYDEILDSLILETLIIMEIKKLTVGGNTKKYKKRTLKKSKQTTKKLKQITKKSKQTTKKSKKNTKKSK